MKRRDTEQYDVLFSYNPAEWALAEAVQERLERAGLSFFAPFAGIEPEDYAELLAPTLERTRAYVPLLSRSSIGSQPLLVEAAAAWSVKIPVLLLLNDAKPGEITVFLEQFRSFQLWKDFPKLVQTIRRLPERQSA